MSQLFVWLAIFSVQNPSVLQISKTHEVYCFGEKVSTLTLIELNEYKLNQLDAQKVCDIVTSIEERN